MAVKQETLYIKGDKNIEVTKPEVTLGDILSMECSNQNVIPRIKTIKVMKMQEKEGQRKVISILKIIKLIHEIYPNIDVQNLGETDIIVTYEEQKPTGMISHLIKIGFTAVLTFTGAAFAIMTFNNDVSVRKLFSQIYQLMTGIKPQGSTILELSYSIGLTIGILLFFNHFGKKKFSVDPTPLEVQMRTYENEIQTTLVENASRKGKELDADTSNSNGSNRS
ncbi:MULTISPECIES: stage V sporulation protein AA [Clostridia]|uniref:stage V sporulation protein AA n=1 Tax=Clostridia TaxID=186801 RepID=UPI000EB35B45|nr:MULTISPECIES: stage V sporulation protein AA [Clostridia]RKQ29417.1 stage V sporulation protein AA [Ruminococcus sp. B05]TAP32865.1 stage V sporulation protein AA [Mediterraneibacter sp. gm002]